MKVLVVTNCAMAAYTSGLRALFPDWDVKGADDLAAAKFVKERHPAFLDHLSSVDLLVTNIPQDPMFDAIPREAAKLVIPNFLFRAFHPDSFYPSIQDVPVPSVFRDTGLHSRLVVTAHILGASVRKTVRAFRLPVYERVGYLSVFESERDSLLGRFAAAGIDISADFDGWMARGDFLHTFNHPKAFVFADILVRALTGRFLPPAECAKARAILAQVPDYLENSIKWPVYPEIAAHYGFKGSLSWKQTRGAGGETLTLKEFVKQSFVVLDSVSRLPSHVVPGFEACAAAIRS